MTGTAAVGPERARAAIAHALSRPRVRRDAAVPARVPGGSTVCVCLCLFVFARACARGPSKWHRAAKCCRGAFPRSALAQAAQSPRVACPQQARTGRSDAQSHIVLQHLRGGGVRASPLLRAPRESLAARPHQRQRPVTVDPRAVSGQLGLRVQLWRLCSSQPKKERERAWPNCRCPRARTGQWHHGRDGLGAAH